MTIDDGDGTHYGRERPAIIAKVENRFTVPREKPARDRVRVGRSRGGGKFFIYFIFLSVIDHYSSQILHNTHTHTHAHTHIQ